MAVPVQGEMFAGAIAIDVNHAASIGGERCTHNGEILPLVVD